VGVPLHVELAEARVCTAGHSGAISALSLPHRVLAGGARGKVAWVPGGSRSTSGLYSLNRNRAADSLMSAQKKIRRGKELERTDEKVGPAQPGGEDAQWSCFQTLACA